MKNKRNIVLLTVVAVASALLARVAIHIFFPRDDPNAYEVQLADAARQLSAKGPQVLDAATRLDGGKAGPGNRFTYIYTLTQLRSTDVDLPEWKANFVPQIKSKMKSAGMQPMFKRGTTVVYRYNGSDGALIGEIEMSPQEGLVR